MKLFGMLMVVVGMAMGGAVWAEGPATAPATKPAAPACCGDECKKMGECCKVDAQGKMTCDMGGGCCVKAK
jgi:hypothetical protein